MRQSKRPQDLPAEIAFLGEHGISRIWLDSAADRARRENVSAVRALVAHEMVGETLLYECLAQHLGVPFLDHRPQLAHPLEPFETIIARGSVRLAEGEAQGFLVAPSDEAIPVLLKARARGLPLHDIAITTPGGDPLPGRRHSDGASGDARPA